MLATARADGTLTFRLRIRGRVSTKYVPPGAELARRRGAAEGGAGRVCAVCAPRPRTLRRGGAPAVLAHRRRRRGPLRFASCRYARCDALCGGMRGGGAGARRTKLEDGFADSVQSWLRTAESLRRVLYARGRPAVCSRGLVAAAHGLSGEPEGVGRLRTSDAALCRALCRFRTAAAACGHGGRAAAAGAQDVRVCRRIRSPFLGSPQLALQEISSSPKPTAPAPKGSRRQHKGGSRSLPHSHQRRHLDLSGCCDMRGQMLMILVQPA